ncbi:alpha/beta fold hydrolase [Nocardia jejuensis]|uniref:alpha/beta fold hydrolase n=1 Tax=Nocardia jejuensis TaxID=328049 RepID=UPI00082EEBC1|nr:alpha/beta hydrolase [Nocardia jejuensis]
MKSDGSATFVLIHGGGSSSWDWHLVEPRLREHGHRVIAVDLPIEDPSTGISEYADAVIAGLGDASNVVVVAHSFGGLTAPVVAARTDVDLLILLSAMIPVPGQAPGDWWSGSGHSALGIKMDTEQEMIDAFLHDVPPELAADSMKHGRDQTEANAELPIPLDAWPDVPTRFLLCRDDHFFPPEFMRPLVIERLGFAPDEIDGSHCVMLSRPIELADRLHQFWTELE